MLTDYIDTEKTTIAILKDYHNQQFKLDSAPDELASINSQLTKVTQSFGATPVTGSGGNRQEDKLVSGIAKKELIQKGVRAASEYMDELLPCWEALSEPERYVLSCRFVEQSGIRPIMERFCVEKSEAYRMSDSALKHLAKLIFW